MSTSSTSATSKPSVTSKQRKRKSDDLGWEYAALVDSKSLDKVKCLLCDKTVSGGIYRMKQHIAGIKGNVAACTKSTKKDQIKCRDAINGAKKKKMGKKQNDEELKSQVNIDIDDLDIDEEMTLREPIGFNSHSVIELMDKFANQINPEKIYWTPCATHSMNLMLDNIENLPKFKKTIDQAKTLTIFIDVHYKTLAMMRGHTKNRDIFRLRVVRFESLFLFLQSISEKRAQLNAIFTSNEWEQCKLANTAEGRTSYTTVLSMEFWNDVTSCLQVLGPLEKVLRLVDEDKKPSMGFVYGGLMKAKEEVKTSLDNIAKNYQPIIDVINANMKATLNNPLYLTAYLLNPFYYYRDPRLHLDRDVAVGIIDCLEVIFPENIQMQVKIMSDELPKYENKESLFGRYMAVSESMQANVETFNPVKWWSNYGSVTPNLQRLAIGILSLNPSTLSVHHDELEDFLVD